MPEQQEHSHQTDALPRTPLAMLMLFGAAFSALMAAIGFAVINMAWIGNTGLLLALLLVVDAVLILKYGLSFFALKEQPHSWFYDFNYETAQIGMENLPQEIRRELERKTHARYIAVTGAVLPCIYFSAPVAVISAALIGYGGWRCTQHYKILAQQFSALSEEPET